MGIYDVFEGGSQPFDKAAWIAKKNEEKQAAYELADSTADRMKTDGDAFRSYLDVQGRFDRYSVTNAILVAAQKPDATQLKDFKKWREDGVTVDKDATKITILEPGNEYTRHDGTRTMGSPISANSTGISCSPLTSFPCRWTRRFRKSKTSCLALIRISPTGSAGRTRTTTSPP